MRKLLFAAMLLVLISSFAVHAQLCEDQDEQPDLDDTYDSAAKVEYGIEDKTDHCLSGKEGYTVSEGRWLREYYCDQDDKRAYKDVDCVGEGYDKCEGGKCVTESGTTPDKPKPAASPSESCGNKKVEADLGEKCDPPDSICYSDAGDIGICTRPNDAGFGGCQCDVYEGAADDAEEVEEAEEEIEEPEEEPEEEVEEAEEEPEEEVEEVEEEPKEEARAPLPTEEYNEMKGVSVTRSITNSVKRFFSWIGSWFG